MALKDSLYERSHDSGSNSVCSKAFKDTSTVVYFVGYVIFFVLSLLVIAVQFYLRKRYNNQTTRKLLGLLYTAAIVCVSISWLLQIIGTLVTQCNLRNSHRYFTTFYNLTIANSVIANLGAFLTLAAVVWGVNSMLSEHLGRKNKSASHRTSSMVIIIGMCMLTIVLIIMQCVFYSSLVAAIRGAALGWFPYGFHIFLMLYSVVWIVNVLVGLGLAIHTLRALKSELGVSITRPLIWIIFAFSALAFSVLLEIVPLTNAFEDNEPVNEPGRQAVFFLATLSQIFSFVAVAMLAINAPWNDSSGDNSGENGGRYQPMGDYGVDLSNPYQRK
ncbi:unnamed protein product [Periconia digitata]|uniref:Uncharacterized protein n=1 Tax=Periconia digitata TaxID=1303443 RepID=A0A9W4XSQ0_9PLEO|nr:unnamed protein product [Periconia digitata]